MRPHHPMPPTERAAPVTRRSFMRALGLLREYLPQLVLGWMLTLAATACALLTPKLKQMGIDEGIIGRNAQRLTDTVMLLLVINGVSLIIGVAQSLLLNWIGQQSVHSLRCRLFSHLQSLSMDFFERREPGNIISRVINDMDAVNELLSSGIISLFADLVALVGISVILFQYNVKLALAIHVVLPLMACVAYCFRTYVYRAFMATRESIAAVTNYLHETVAGIRVIQSFARESVCEEKFRRQNSENERANITAATIWATFFPILEIVSALGTVVIFGYGGLLILRHEMTIGIAVAFVLYMNQWFDPVRRLTEMFTSFQRALVAIDRVYEVLDEEPSVKSAANAITAPPLERTVEFRDVTFGYDGAYPVLRNVDLHAHMGETVALVGPTGAGKSTIIKLLTRMYDTQQGEICIDGRDIRTLSLESIRRQMGIVPQDTFLFAGTVRDNIAYGRPEASAEEVRRVARIVNAAEFIEKLPEGYNTNVHERGIKLSVGQRQLIAFARALLVNPRILILDEATSSIDHFTEKQIQEAIRILLRDRVAFVIAHRLSTVVNADTILVIDRGEIIARGKHDALLRTCELYRNLYERRFKAEEPKPVTIPETPKPYHLHW